MFAVSSDGDDQRRPNGTTPLPFDYIVTMCSLSFRASFCSALGMSPPNTESRIQSHAFTYTQTSSRIKERSFRSRVPIVIGFSASPSCVRSDLVLLYLFELNCIHFGVEDFRVE